MWGIIVRFVKSDKVKEEETAAKEKEEGKGGRRVNSQYGSRNCFNIFNVCSTF